MADSIITVGSTGMQKRLVDLGSSIYADAVAQIPADLADEVVLADATTSTDGLGKIPNIAATTGVMYPCFDASLKAYTRLDWRVKGAAAHTVQPYRARSRVDSVTLTLATVLDTGAFTINGLTYTGESTANTATYDAREFDVSGNDTAAAAALAALINADYSVVTAGTSVTAEDKLIITTDEGAFTVTAAAAADYPGSKYALDATAATELASIVLAINHKDTFQFTEDTTAFAGTNPATEADPTGYALSIELIADHNTHTASTVWHYQTTAAVSTTAATTEATFFAQVNAARTAMLAHYANVTAHGVADATNYAAVLATTVATNAATALTLVNLLAAAHLAHVATARARAGDTVTINGITYTGAASTVAATRTFIATPATSVSNIGVALVTCVNDRDTVIFTSAVANDSVTITETKTGFGPLDTTAITYYGKIGAAVSHDHRFSIDTSDTATGASFAALVNADFEHLTATNVTGTVTIIPDYGYTATMLTGVGGVRLVCKAGKGVPGVTAVNASGTVSLTRASADYTITHSTTNGAASPHRVIPAVDSGGVPGVIAAATPGTATAAELSITPTWTTALDVREEGARLTVTDIDCPGVFATSAAAVVTLRPGSYAAGMGAMASVIYAVTGTAAATVVVANNTLANLIKHGAASTVTGTNATTAGTFYEQWLDGWPYAYCAVTNTGDAAAYTVGATPYS